MYATYFSPTKKKKKKKINLIFSKTGLVTPSQCDDSGTKPGTTTLVTFMTEPISGVPSNEGYEYQFITLLATSFVSLTPGTAYWVVAKATSNSYNWYYATSGAQAVTGGTIGGVAVTSDGSTWTASTAGIGFMTVGMCAPLPSCETLSNVGQSGTAQLINTPDKGGITHLASKFEFYSARATTIVNITLPLLLSTTGPTVQAAIFSVISPLHQCRHIKGN